MPIPPYPLAWPEGMPRTARPISGQFKTTLYKAIENVEDSLRRFASDSGQKVTDVVVTSNKAGLTSAGPADKGVSIWFDWDGQQRCIAVDRYDKLEHNVQAIHHIIEARRTEMRHGGLNVVRQTFKGFTALPAPERWWQVLGVGMQATRAEIEAAYRQIARAAHPDTGGSTDAMARLNAARDAGLANPTARNT